MKRALYTQYNTYLTCKTLANGLERSLFEKRYEEFYEPSVYQANKLLNNKLHAEEAVHEAFLDVIKK